MSRLSVYVPDDLAERARRAGLNISALAQEAIRAELEGGAALAWLADLPVGSGRTPHAAALSALDEARAEFGGEFDGDGRRLDR